MHVVFLHQFLHNMNIGISIVTDNFKGFFIQCERKYYIIIAVFLSPWMYVIFLLKYCTTSISECNIVTDHFKCFIIQRERKYCINAEFVVDLLIALVVAENMRFVVLYNTEVPENSSRCFFPRYSIFAEKHEFYLVLYITEVLEKNFKIFF